MAKIEEQRKDNQVRQQGKQDARHLQEEIPRLDFAVTEFYGVRVTTIMHAADTVSADLEYLCSLVEQPDPEFSIVDAVSYAGAVAALSHQLDFIVEDLSENDLSEDQEYVKLSKEDIIMLNSYTSSSEEAISRMEEVCGISLQNN